VNHHFQTQRDAALAVLTFIDGWYNPASPSLRHVRI
jgi:hypothetical protein